ncbi:MAG: helix-turn-helix domain-containing protein [Rhodospirillales bacterium]|nr:helix-turn-helix domain-containing protein [Rhodospirillales bacterium]
MEKLNYRAPDAAQYLGLAESTLAKMRLRGDGPGYSKAGRAVIYARAELDRWLASLRRSNTSQRSPDAA